MTDAPVVTETCGCCHHTAPLSELDLFPVFAGVGDECKDHAACRRRADEWNAANYVDGDGHDLKCESEFDHAGWKWLPCDCALRAEERAEADR